MNSINGGNKGNNITCLIEDIDNLSDNENFSWTSVELTNDPLQNNIIDNEIYAKELNYNLNFSTKYLGLILDYYGIPKSKLKKELIIKKIIEFEINPNNIEIVERRIDLFDKIIELKNDDFFKKFIIWNI
jgi:hypothetical protein